jgi:hypothetical protein
MGVVGQGPIKSLQQGSEHWMGHAAKVHVRDDASGLPWLH